MNLSHSERSRNVELHGVTYHTRFDGAGEPVLLLHGFTGSGASWWPVVGGLANRFTVIRPDLPGHGRTTAPTDAARYRINAAAKDLIELLDRLGLAKVGLHGYSMGGRLALYTALAYPDRIHALSLESVSPGLATEAERRARIASDEALAKRIEQSGVAAFVDEWERLPLFATQSRLPPSILAHQREQRLTNIVQGLAGSLRGMGTGAQPSLWNRLGELTMRVLLLTGTLDTKFTAIADEMAARIPNAERAQIDDCGHAVYLEQPSAWIEAVGGFFMRP